MKGFQSMNRWFIKIFAVVLLTASLAACGNESPQGQDGSGDPATSGSPNVGNLPPPDGNSSVGSQSAPSNQGAIFFQRKELWDTFSAELKTQVQTNYGKSGTMVGAGPGGHGYYNTLFGRTSPAYSSSGGSSTTLSLPNLLQVPGGNSEVHVMALEVTSASACNAASTFLCLDRPAEGEGTVIDSILVKGGINLSEAGLFNPEDPVVLISVFRQSGEAVNEYGLKAADLSIQTPASEDDPQTASFNKTVGLAGPGSYTIVVSAFKNVGDSVILESIGVTVVRQDVPEIELVSLLPPPQGNLYPTDPEERDDPVSSGDTVSMASVKTTVRLKSPGTTNVGIIFENFDQSGNLRYITNGDAGFGTEDQDDGSVLPTKSADLPLAEGLNKIRITAHNSILDQLGFSPDEPSTIEFNLTNVVPKVTVKMMSPEDGKIIEATGAANQKVDVAFCLTDLTSLPGRTSPAGAGECILNWNGEKPAVTFNGHTLASSEVSKDGSGVYKAQVKPQLGANLVEVAVTNTHFLPSVDEETPALTLGQGRASVSFGEVSKLVVNGDLTESNNFTKRGLSLEINKKIITGDVKTMISKFLNDPDFKDTFINLFKKTSPGITNVCTEVNGYSVDTGDSSIDLLKDTLNLGSFDILELTPQNDNKLHIRARMNGFSGEADLRGLNSTVQIQEDGVDLSFIPITIGIKEMTISVDLTFPKKNGLSQIDLLKDANYEIVQVVGSDALGRFVWINSSRNPLAAGLESIYGPGDVLGDTFLKALKRNFACGLENSLNNGTTGLGQWQDDLKKLVGYNNLNPFRIPLEFDMLNKLVGVDISYDLLRGDITFNDRGAQIQNVPLRINASPRALNHLTDLLGGSISEGDQTPEDKQILSSPNRSSFGPLAAPRLDGETPATNSSTNEVRNFGLQLPEDAINQALFAANLAGMLDLDIDPNFWTNNEIKFIDKATPTVQDMLGAKVDINQNGIEDDERLPVLLRLRTDKTMAPVLHFLSQTEISELAERVNCFLNKGEGDAADAPCNPSTFTNRLNPDLRYFRLSIPNAEISIYRVYPLGTDVGGVKTYCSKADPIAEPESLYATRPSLPPFKLTGDPAVDNANRACRQTVSPINETIEATCPEGYNRLVIPVKNGPVISAVPVAPGEPEVPVVRYKGDLVLHGVIQGTFREVLFADQYENSGAPAKNFLRLKFVPADFGPEMLYLKMKVVENRTGISESALTNQLSNVVIPGALGTNCETLNELQITLPDRFPDNETTQSQGGLMETLHDFGVHHIDFGDSSSEVPNVFVDDNHMYLDVLVHLGICYEGETCTQPSSGLNSGIIHRISTEDLLRDGAITRLKMIDWSKH